MASRKRIAAKGYAGVFYVEVTRVHSSQIERVYYIRYRRDGKLVEEKAGHQYRDNMTPAKAAGMRAARMEKREANNADKRVIAKQEHLAQLERSTVSDIFSAYQESIPNRNWATDRSLYRHYLLAVVSRKTPCELLTADMDTVRTSMFKAGKSAQTVKHALALVKRIIRFGVKRGMTPMPDPSRLFIELPKVDNIKTEVLTPAQISALVHALDEEDDPLLTGLVRLAMCTGMRRGSLLGLQWKDIDFEKKTISVSKTLIEIDNPEYDVNNVEEMKKKEIKKVLFTIQSSTKTKHNRQVPMNSNALLYLRSHLENSIYTEPDDFVITTRNRKTSTPKNISDTLKCIVKGAELSTQNYNTHILRHTCASLYFKSNVDLLTISNILGNSPEVLAETYVHFQDEQLKEAACKQSNLLPTLSF